MADPAAGEMVVHGTIAPQPSKKKKINLLDRSPSPVILDDYGELEPARCTVGGPGVAGGTVGVATQVSITARDANGIGIREGGLEFVVTLQHCSKGGQGKTYKSIDHGDGHYTVPGIRADWKGMHQLSVEVNGSLVGDSPYHVMFEVDDGVPQGYNEDAPPPPTRSKGGDVKERILFIQHMNPEADIALVQSTFGKFGKLVKCERMLPAKDMWMVQFSTAKDAEDALSLSGTEIMGCKITLMLATHAGGIGTHQLIIAQLHHLQSLHLQEQHSSSLASMLVQQRAAIRESGGDVEELTDTRKKHKAVALMQRLRMKAAAANTTPPAAQAGAEGASPTPASPSRKRDEVDLRKESAAERERARERDRDRERDRRRDSHRDRHREGDRERHRERERPRDREHNGRERSRDRDSERKRDRYSNRERSRDRDRSTRDRDRDRHREWDRDRSRRRERNGERDRDRHRESDRGRDRDRDRDRGRERSSRDKAKDSERDRGRKDAAPERKDAAPERDRSQDRSRARSPADDVHDKKRRHKDRKEDDGLQSPAARGEDGSRRRRPVDNDDGERAERRRSPEDDSRGASEEELEKLRREVQHSQERLRKRGADHANGEHRSKGRGEKDAGKGVEDLSGAEGRANDTLSGSGDLDA